MSAKVGFARAACLLMLLCASLPAQETTGTIIGAVRDESGALIPQAAVIIRNINTGSERRVNSGESGEWDVAIRAGANEDPTLGARLLGAPPAVLCATPAYLLKHPAPERPEGLRDHALLTPAGQGTEYRFQMTKASARAEVRVRPARTGTG